MFTTPLLLAFSCKGALLSIVEILFPLILIPSKVASEPTVKLFVTFTSPVITISPPCTMLPVTLTFPFTCISCKVLEPPTVRLLSTCKVLLGIITFPVPLAYNSKSAFELFTLIVFVFIVKSSTLSSLTQSCFHL